MPRGAFLGVSRRARLTDGIASSVLAENSRQELIKVKDLDGPRYVSRIFWRRYDFEISSKGVGDENGSDYTLAGEEPRVPATYGEVMRYKFEKHT